MRSKSWAGNGVNNSSRDCLEGTLPPRFQVTIIIESVCLEPPSRTTREHSKLPQSNTTQQQLPQVAFLSHLLATSANNK